MLEDDSEPLGPVDAYRVSAIGHLHAARMLHAKLLETAVPHEHAVWLGLQNLIGFAAETAMKAYITPELPDPRELRFAPYGHNLANLLRKCEELGLEQAGIAVKQPRLVAALRRYVELCGGDFVAFNYRYLGGSRVDFLKGGEATNMTIRAIECLVSIAGKKAG